MDGKIIVLLRTSSVARVPAYRHLRDLGAVLVLVHPVPPLADFNGIFHFHLLHDTDDVDALEKSLTAFLAERNLRPDATVSFDEYAVYAAAVLSQRAGRRPIPLPPAKVRSVCVKSTFRAFCAARGIASPLAAVLPRLPDNTDMLTHVREWHAVSGLSFPLVLKPSPGSGSLLAKICHSVEEVCDHALFMWNVLNAHADVRHFDALLKFTDGVDNLEDFEQQHVEILAEDYIGGKEVDMDCCIENGQIVFCSISENFDVRPPYCVEEGGLCPSSLPIDAQKSLTQLLEDFVAAHGEELHGVLHFEAKYDFATCRAYVIEVNCRLGSAETNTMVRTCYRGLQLGESLVRCALGLSVRAQLRRHYPETETEKEKEKEKENEKENEKEKEKETEKEKEATAGAGPLLHAETVAAALGGPTRGMFAPSCCCASVNVYPSREGTLARAEVPVNDTALVDYSVSAVPGELVKPPPKAFYLLAWIVARGETADAATKAIRRITENFVEEIVAAN